MSSQKQMREAKSIITKSFEELSAPGYTFVGFGTAGAIFESESGQYVIAKAIAKKEGYDAMEDIREQLEKEEKQAQAEAKKAEKAKKRKEKEAE
jgi:uridine phosphorylase